jgi:hypothetical protein
MRFQKLAAASALAVCLPAIVMTPQVTSASITKNQEEAAAWKDPPKVEELGSESESLDSEPSDPIEAEKFICTTKCAIEGENQKCTGWVVGEGTDKTESDACKAAKADASKNVEALLPGEGCKAKHCRPCECKKKK